MPATFRFTHLPITDHKDTTAVLEHLQPVITGLQDQAAALEARLRSAASVVPGAWANPEGFSAKTEEHTTLQVRTEQGGTTARLKGFLKAKEELPAETTVFTLPFHPKETVRLVAIDLNTSAVILAYVSSAGAVVNHSAVTAAHFWSFDGLTYPLT